jgi:geranylgeranyl diphosphate synthase type II
VSVTDVDRPPAPVSETLLRYSELTQRAMQMALPAREPRSWLYDLASSYPARGGKAIRPSLCLATCGAFGGRVAEALPSATAIELMHNAFLIHDDIEDQSLLRRGEPTLHATGGSALALNAGDALLVTAQQCVLENIDVLGPRLARRVADEFVAMAQHTTEGQATELGWIRDNVVELTPDDYLDMVMRKTCWYTTVHPLRVGALIGSWGTVPLQPFVRFGFHLGAAFQIQDDLLNLLGDEARYGKEILGDLLEGKRTLMLIHLLRTARGAERDDLVAYLGRPRPSRSLSEARHLRDLMIAHGSIEFARDFAQGIAYEAETSFERAFGARAAATPHGEFVRGLISYMLDRTS